MTTRRPKPPQSTWLIDQRKRRGWKPEDVAARLDAAVATVRGWESGRGIGPDALIRLEALFGVTAPGDEPAAGGYADVVAAIDRQTAMLERVLSALTGLSGPGLATPADIALAEPQAEAAERLLREQSQLRELGRHDSEAEGSAAPSNGQNDVEHPSGTSGREAR